MTTSVDAPPRLLGGAFAAVFAASLVFFTGGGIVLPIAPRFAEGPIGADAIGFGIAIGIWSFASLAVRPLVGWSADRYGRRPLLVVGALLTVLALALHLVGDQPPAVHRRPGDPRRRGGGFLVAALAATGDLAPPGRTGEALSLVSLSLYIGLVVGPVLGEAVLGAAGYAGVWIVAAALSIIAAGLAWLVPETRPAAPPAAANDAAGPRRRGRLLHPAGILPGVIILCGLSGMAGVPDVPAAPRHGARAERRGAGARGVRGGRHRRPPVRREAAGPGRGGATDRARRSGSRRSGSVIVALVGGQPGLLLGSAILGAGVAMTMPAVLTLAISRAPATERGSVVGTASLFLDLAFGLAPVVPRADRGRRRLPGDLPRVVGRRGRGCGDPARHPVAARRRAAARGVACGDHAEEQRMTIERVFVAGAGLMGHGIAQVHAAIGKQVALYEPDLARAEAGRDRIAGNLERPVAKGKLDAAERDATLARLDRRPTIPASPPTRTSSSRRCSRISRSRPACGRRST